MKIIMLGAPGAGKGTQAEKVSERYGIPAISTGAIIRNAIKTGTPMGTAAKAYTEKGYACAVHVPHLNDFNTDLVEMRKGRSVEDLDRQRMAELETAFEQSAEEEPEQGMEV